jgi:hypothetical protein
LKYSTPYFNDASFKYVDNSSPGWKPTPDNIVAVRDNVRVHVAQHVSAFVFDLLGNSLVRFEQFDGSLSLPYKSQGKFHLGGKVVVSPPDVFKKTVSAIIPILLEKKDIPCIVVPPLPRYLFSRCCNDPSHCTNADEVDFRETMLTGFLQQRGELIKTLVTAGVTNFKVLDACCTTTCATTANTKTRLTDLKNVFAGDGVHFVAAGYQNLAARSLVCIRALLSAPPRASKNATSFWRGFRSPIGSNRVLSVPASANRGRGGGGLPSTGAITLTAGTDGIMVCLSLLSVLIRNSNMQDVFARA